MYHALYRKYRPQDFNSVVGQDSIVKTLRNSIKNKSFGHAYMFFGPRGVGKTTASKIFARAVNCLDPIDGNACGKCEACKHSFEKECVDIIEIDAASNNGVDEIRELKNKISLVPAELKYKVYIIDEVHMLSIGAFNALLKTLEEPPEHAIFILATTDSQKVPDTIISRCQCFSFKRISNDMIVDRLRQVCASENINIDDEVLSEIAIASDGGMRDALSSLDKLVSYSDEKITIEVFAELNGVITKNNLNLLCTDIFAGNLAAVLSKISEYNNQGKNLIQIITQIMHYLRNLTINYYISNENTSFSVKNMLVLINIINEKLNDIKRSSNPKIYIEMLLIKYINNLSGTSSEVPDTKDISREIKSDTSKNISQEINDDKSKSISQEINVNKSENISREINNGEERVQNNAVNKDNSSPIVNSDESNADDVEYDFSSEFSDDDNEYSEQYISSNNNPSVDNDSCDEDETANTERKILNIDEIMSARVNNTLALANKQILNDVLEKMKLFNDFTFDQEIGYIACSLLDAHVRAASEDSIILSYEYDSVVKQNLAEIDKFIDVYNKVTNSDKKLAMITDEQWDVEKQKYIKNIKDGIPYKVVEEPNEVFEDIKNDDIIVNNAIELFGDIVEIK